MEFPPREITQIHTSCTLSKTNGDFPRNSPFLILLRWDTPPPYMDMNTDLWNTVYNKNPKLTRRVELQDDL